MKRSIRSVVALVTIGLLGACAMAVSEISTTPLCLLRTAWGLLGSARARMLTLMSSDGTNGLDFPDDLAALP